VDGDTEASHAAGTNGSGSSPTSRGAEAQATAEAAVEDLLRALGQDPTREGLQETPRRVVSCLRELTDGYERDPEQILSTRFAADNDDVVTVRRIGFTSLCEHHLLPIRGHATVAYLPDDEIVGLSKISRLVQAFAKRLQVQERMTRQIADALDEHVGRRGVGVAIAAEHDCMSRRGVETPAEMVTTAFRGELDREPTRQRLLATLDGGTDR